MVKRAEKRSASEILDAHTQGEEAYNRDRMPATQEPQLRDEVLQMGPAQQLVGIVSPGRHAEPGSRPGVILLNAGVLHRVGPHRLHVRLARELAAAGFTTLRLDLGGVGDSVSASDATTFRETAVADTQMAMARLAEQYGLRSFVVVGLCAGADNALATALADDRVRGIVVIDPPTYATRAAKLRVVTTRIAEEGPLDALKWGLGVIRRAGREQLARVSAPPSEPVADGRETPPLAVYAAQMLRVRARGAAIFAVFSGAHRERYNHVDQIFEAIPALRGQIAHAYFPEANHTFTELAAQSALVAAVLRWCAGEFR